MSQIRLQTIGNTIICLSLFAISVFAQQNTHEIFERARMLDESNQNLSEAIKLYGQVVSQSNEQRALAARAQYRIAVLYDRLGRKAEAQRAYQAVVKQYGDQSDVVARARAKLPAPAVKTATAKTKTAASDTGARVRQVWTGDGVDSMGSASSDGRFLSFVDWSTGDLAIRDLVAGKNRRLTNKGTWAQSNQYAEFSRVSPDGRQIAYAWFNDKFYDVRVMGSDGSNMRVLHQNPELTYVFPAAWFPDGKTIAAVLTRKDRSNQIVLISIADGSVRTLKTLDWRYPERISVSTDGRWIAYDLPPKEDSFRRDIYLLATDASQEVPLVEHRAHDYLLGWSPDSGKIIFASDRTGTVSVWSVQVVSGKPHGAPAMIKHDAGQIYPLGLTRDGSLYYSLGGTRDVQVGEFDSASGKLLSLKNATDLFVGANTSSDWSPDGEHLAYLSRRSPSREGIGSKVVVIQSVKTGEERVLEPQLILPRNHRGGPRWSPDSRYLLVAGWDVKGRRGIYRINTQTGESDALVQSQPGLQLPEWGPDGKIIFTREGFGDDSNTYLVSVDVTTGKEIILHKSRHIHAIAVSPDYRWVAFSTEYPVKTSAVAMASALMILPTADVKENEPREILRLSDTEEINAVVWTADGQHLLFGQTKSPVENRQVWRIPITGGKVVPTQLEMSPRQLMGFRFHRDGRRVTFTDYSSATAEVLVMENFLPPTQPRKAVSRR